MISYYVKKPVVVEAVKVTFENVYEVYVWIGCEKSLDVVMSYPRIRIETLEGIMNAHVGDYIIRGTHGEYYPVKPEIFEENYGVVVK